MALKQQSCHGIHNATFQFCEFGSCIRYPVTVIAFDLVVQSMGCCWLCQNNIAVMRDGVEGRLK
eukprot:scaffold155183_cov70-Cyclotella_meneghiniana.AAC.7